ncbi:LETM1-related biofilm-associated protein [Allomuricauda sp. SCSIO 65647]|uniref:LETM1-related biofilm-associated protein n=1 Tax=Allomuricauda sp. SCSIO 65647 TaxID=2908843 RepID=UPI001F166506|nr:LETM1-related biofilm-associated protein [Muricauda sp. SCSIO 65647]UJH67756.1 LETM1-related biofilm-associated protein [Muricauda sp. SCSIO 65647]
MNPSASGWIKKFGHLVQDASVGFDNYDALYQQLRDNGFVYGIHLYYPAFVKPEHALSEDEVAKVNLLTALYFVHKFQKGGYDFDGFVNIVFNYYQELDVGKISFLNKILTGSKTDSQLEKLIDSRIYLGDNVINRTFGNSITNSLLFVDVLIFKYYLEGGKDVLEHARLLEYVTINIAFHALSSKDAGKNDEKLVQVLASSLTYANQKQNQFDGSYREVLQDNFSQFEKDYLLDIACLTVWEDQSLEFLESEFIYGIGKDLGKSRAKIEKAINNVKVFFEKNFEKIPYLKDRNLAFQFYEGMSKNVSKLILRNSKRLKKELMESKELMALLSKSTIRELSPEEKKRVQHQLVDIFKSIPSLAIFMLPGGAILLPIFIKLIPTLLPSAFDDNRVEKKADFNKKDNYKKNL